eukprot:TRINITY_DN78859_c0_g1_i1.p1 TRINITY_DN78859_c0_g1~~TRINITY_DN78859_c0_g1_i1.p1  ORF type:complete len:1062 (+),score=179.13 TRINITY_DN78859_c0_g1_i1:160-3345(+)
MGKGGNEKGSKGGNDKGDKGGKDGDGKGKAKGEGKAGDAGGKSKAGGKGKGKKGEEAKEQSQEQDSQQETFAEEPSSPLSAGGEAEGATGKAKGRGKKGRGKAKAAQGEDEDKAEEDKLVEDILLQDEDWYFEDTLREVLEERTVKVPVVNFPQMHVSDVVASVDDGLHPYYSGLVHRLRGKLKDYDERCRFAEEAHQEWLSERHYLIGEMEQWKSTAEEQRERAIASAAKSANANMASLKIMRNVGRSAPRSGMASGGFDVDFEYLEKDIGKLDVQIQKSSFRQLREMLAFIYLRLPLTGNTKHITSQYGEACGAFFHWHSVLLLYAVISIACYAPLLIPQQLERWNELGHNFCPQGIVGLTTPCEWLYGSFKTKADLAEGWAEAVKVSFDHEGVEIMRSMGKDAFDGNFSACPVVRYQRDCKVHSVYAGFINNSSVSPHDLFTSTWSLHPGTINQDFVIFSTYADLLNSEQPWTCNFSHASVGYPADCGRHSGIFNFGLRLESHKEWFTLDQTKLSKEWKEDTKWHMASLEVFVGTTCPVKTQADIQDLANERTRPSHKSGRDVHLALRYCLTTIGTSTLLLLIVMRNWYRQEARFAVESFSEGLSKTRWSQWVLGAWDFRLLDQKQQAEFRESLANQLRAEYEEEKDSEGKGETTYYGLLAKRVSGIFLNVVLVACVWVSIAVVNVYKTDIERGLLSLAVQGSLRSVLQFIGSFFPNLVIGIWGVVLPNAIKSLTKFEGWSRATRARHNLWRLFASTSLMFTAYGAINVFELMSGENLLFGRSLVVRECRRFQCAEDEVAMSLASLVVSELIFSLALRPLTKLGAASMKYSALKLSAVLFGKTQPDRFPWPEFSIADIAVDVTYCQTLVWAATVLSPFLVLFMPVIWYLHYKWMLITVTRLTSRPFAAESASLAIALRRLRVISAIIYNIWVYVGLAVQFPHDPQCGPFDSHQSAFRMILSLDLAGATIYDWTIAQVRRTWSIGIVFLAFLIVLLALRLAVSMRTNSRMLERMQDHVQDQVDRLQKDLYRLERKSDLYKKRIGYLERNKLADSEAEKH